MQTRVFAVLVMCLVLIAGIASVTPARAEDGPNFRILQPTGEQAITDQFPIAVAFQSVDDTPIVRFDAYIDTVWVIGGRIKNPIPAGSFQVTADLTKVNIKPGAHTLYVKLVDSVGRVTQREQAITVGASAVEHVPPTVRIVAPKDGAGISGSATIKIEASDDSGIKWVMLYINGQLRMMMNEAPYIVPWDPIKDKLAAGAYTLRARALDTFDNETTSDPVVIRVVRSQGLTPIETGIPAVGQATLGIFEVSNLYQPTGGPVLPRLAFSNVIAPLSNWLTGNALPQPTLFAAGRNYPMPMVEGGLPALLPPKSLPGQSPAGSDLTSRSLPPAPVLAWASFRLPRPGQGGGYPAAMPSLLMPFDQALPRNAVDADPVSFTAILPRKGIPAINERSLYAVPETPAEPKAPSARALPAPDREEPANAPVLVALVPGTMMRLTPPKPAPEVTALPARSLTPDAGLPRKSSPTPGETPLPAAQSVSPITPSHGSTPSRPATGATAPHPAAGATAPTTTAGQAARPGPQSPAPATALPVKTSPVLTTSATLPATRNATPFTPNPAGRINRPANTVPLPTAPAAIMEVSEPYTTQPDDTLEKIARAFSTTPDELVKLNPHLSPERPLPVNAAVAVPGSETRIYLDAAPLMGAVEPYITQGYTMVPIRKIVEAKDGIVIWLPKTREVNAWADNTFMGVKIGDRHARINAESYLLPVAPTLNQQRTMVPLRYLMSALDLHVEYNAASGTYYLVSR